MELRAPARNGAREAHRSQYDFVDGFARHLRDELPNASVVGFSGKPIERVGANTRAVLAKGTASIQRSDEEMDYAVRQIVSRALVAGEVVDTFSAAGLRKSDISIVSDESLAETSGLSSVSTSDESCGSMATLQTSRIGRRRRYLNGRTS